MTLTIGHLRGYDMLVQHRFVNFILQPERASVRVKQLG